MTKYDKKSSEKASYWNEFVRAEADHEPGLGPILGLILLPLQQSPNFLKNFADKFFIFLTGHIHRLSQNHVQIAKQNRHRRTRQTQGVERHGKIRLGHVNN